MKKLIEVLLACLGILGGFAIAFLVSIIIGLREHL